MRAQQKSGWNTMLGSARSFSLCVCEREIDSDCTEFGWSECECTAFTLIELDLLNETISISRSRQMRKENASQMNASVRPLFCVRKKLNIAYWRCSDLSTNINTQQTICECVIFSLARFISFDLDQNTHTHWNAAIDYIEPHTHTTY